MKKIYYTFFILLSVNFLKAQQLIAIPNDSAEISATVTDGFEPYDSHLEIINNSGAPASVTWGLVDYNALPDWELKLCDNNNCYDLLLSPGPHVSLSVPNGDTIDMKAQFTSHCTAGSGSMNVYAYVTGDSANSVIILNYKATLASNCVSGIATTAPVHLNIYPNPVRSSFVVTGIEDAGNLSFEVYDIKGGRVKSEVKDASNTQIEISLQNIAKGSYILKAFDASGKVVGTSLLSKVE